jgi:hypothetical protein
MSDRPTDRRRTRNYERKRADLPQQLRLELDLVEERILSEGDPPHRYRAEDDLVYDLSSFRQAGIVVAYLPAPDGNHLFVDFTIAE